MKIKFFTSEIAMANFLDELDKDSLFYATNGTWSNSLSSTSPGVRLENSDPSSFVDLPGLYAKDKNNVYVTIRPYEGLPSTRVLREADASTFMLLNEELGLARDDNTVFW